MSIFKRLRDISLSSLHELLNRAEDPVALMNQYVRDMETELSEAEVAFARQIAAEKRAQHLYEEAAELAEKREQGALAALRDGDEALARRAIEDKKEHESRAATYLGQYESAKAQSEEMRERLREMKSELERMRAEQRELAARAAAAKSQKRMNEAMGKIGRGSAVADFDRMKGKVAELEAEAEASGIVRGETRKLDRELDALGRRSEVDEELARLKAQLDSEKPQS